MKTASAATLAILASGQYYKAELYELALASGSTYRFTTADIPLVVSGQTYDTGLIIRRGSVISKVGTEVQTLDLTIAPVFDRPGGQVLISGVPFLTAVKRKELDNARVMMRKIFLSNWEDTSPGAVFWFQGRVNAAQTGRSSAQISVNSDIELLNIAMPRNLYQPGCVHTVFDAGCALSEAAFQVSGAVTGVPGVLQFNTNLGQANDYFSLGKIRFTSGANNGVRRTVKSYVNASGAVTLIYPLPSAPAPGDTFVAAPGCDKRQSTCQTKFSNLGRFRGHPYIPVPETIYGGGAAAEPVGASGRQFDGIRASRANGDLR